MPVGDNATIYLPEAVEPLLGLAMGDVFHTVVWIAITQS